MRDGGYFRQPRSLARHSAKNGASKIPVLVLMSVLYTLAMGGVASAEEHSYLVFEDDFEGGKSIEWLESAEDSNPSWEIVTENSNSFLRGTDWQAIGTGSPEWSDYTLEFLVRLGGSENGGACFRRNYNAQKYCLSLYNNQIILRKHQELGAWVKDSSKVLDKSYFNYYSNKWYKVRIECIGNNIKVYLDDDKKIDFIDYDAPILNGSFHLNSIDENPVDYDDVKVYMASPLTGETSSPSSPSTSYAPLIIDEMESTSNGSIFVGIVDERWSSADIFPVPGKDGKALEISYNLEDKGWVSISREIDPYTLLEIDGISFDYWGGGNPNTLEFKLAYEDGTDYGRLWHNATNVKEWKTINVSLVLQELECWFPEENCEKYGELNLSLVRFIEFAVSDKGTEVGDKGGAGRIIIDNVRRKIPPVVPPPTGPAEITIVTNSSWKSLYSEVEGWTRVNFDDSGWEDTEEEPEFLKIDWWEDFINDLIDEGARAIWYSGTPRPQTAYFRKSFEIDDAGDDAKVISGKIYAAVYTATHSEKNNSVHIYVNDNYVGSKEGGSLGKEKAEFDITPYLNPGNNVIAVKAEFEEVPGDRNWWALIGKIRTTLLSTGSISASSTPSGAEVYLDGASKGTTPVIIGDVSAGSHALEFRKTGYKTYSENVAAKAGDTVTISPHLELIPASPLPTKVPETPPPIPRKVILLVALVVLAGGGAILLRKRERPKEAQKPVRELINEAVARIGGVVSIDDVFNYISRKYPERENRETISTSMSDLAVNGPPSSLYKDSEKFLFRVDRGRYRLYDPERDGVWENGKKVSEHESVPPTDFIPRPTTPSTFPPELQAGYMDVEYLDKGGFARVFKAKRKSDGKTVAVKIPISLDEATGRSFLKEIKAWEELKHENIVELYDMNIMPISYFEMEYVENKSLEEMTKPLKTEKAARIVFDIAEGLKYAHGEGIIHRDLKPQNVLLTKDLTPKISDWGLSKVLAEGKTSSIASFTPLYAAPEQISPKQFGGPPDNRTDVYGLGVIFYELVTGKLPFGGESIAEISNAIMNEEPVKPSEINPEAKDVAEIIMRCLATNREGRYLSAEELQKALADYLKPEYNKSLKESTSKGDLTRSRILRADLVMLAVKLGDYTEVLKSLSILKGDAKPEEKAKIENLIEEIEMHVKEGVGMDEGLVNRIKTLAYEVQMK